MSGLATTTPRRLGRLRFSVRACLLAMCTGGVLLGWLGIVGMRVVTNRWRYPAFDEVQLGDTREQVLALMGEPSWISAEFRLGQRAGYEAEYEAAAVCDAGEWLIYHTPPDWTMAIGIDANDRVVFKSEGGT